MKKYISAEAAAEKLRNYKIERDLMVSHNDTIDFAISVISAEVPAADVVEVVRCKDCKEFQASHHWCGFLKIDIDPGEFCSYGERRADNGN